MSKIAKLSVYMEIDTHRRLLKTVMLLEISVVHFEQQAQNLNMKLFASRHCNPFREMNQNGFDRKY